MRDHFPEKPWACRCGCGLDRVDPELVRRLNLARELAGAPFEISSACRCAAHNQAVGGRPRSAHVSGQAADILIDSTVHRYAVLAGLFGAGFRRIGIGPTFVHADVADRPPLPSVWMY